MTETDDDLDARLDPARIRRDARHVLSKTTNVEDLVYSLIRTIRMQDREGRNIREGYGHSQELMQEDYRLHTDEIRRDIARAIRRELRCSPPPGQHLTYSGGLRRAARIAEGWFVR